MGQLLWRGARERITGATNIWDLSRLAHAPHVSCHHLVQSHAKRLGIACVRACRRQYLRSPAFRLIVASDEDTGGRLGK
jgi:energy-coupling factor transporter ATP-binding protein EcfA2